MRLILYIIFLIKIYLILYNNQLYKNILNQFVWLNLSPLTIEKSSKSI